MNPFESSDNLKTNEDLPVNKIIDPLLNNKWNNKTQNEYKNYVNPFLNKVDK